MHEHLFNHVDILPENINIPDGTVTAENILQYCIDYEMKIKKVGGLDFQLLGIGRTGHIGFNEPGSHLNSETRIITLDHITRIDAHSLCGNLEAALKDDPLIEKIMEANRIDSFGLGSKTNLILLKFQQKVK